MSRQPNLCESELHAVDHANKRFSQGYTATGAGCVVCARHGLVRKERNGKLAEGGKVWYSACSDSQTTEHEPSPDMPTWISFYSTRSSAPTTSCLCSLMTSPANGHGTSRSAFFNYPARCRYRESSFLIAPMRDTQISHLRSRNIMSVQFFTQISQVHGSYRLGKTRNAGGRISIRLV